MPARKPAFAPPDDARRERIWRALEDAYGDTSAPLRHEDPWQLLVATVLSAQTTDIAVNKLTPALFARFPTPQKMAAGKLSEIESKIKTIGLYRNKAKFCRDLSRQLIERFGGKVPQTMEELTTLPGVGRKTAQVVLYHAFGQPGLAVDTHVHRLSNRIGLARSKTPEQTEQQLKAQFAPERWGALSIRLIWHGRRVCDARKPRCEACMIRRDCDFGSRENH